MIHLEFVDRAASTQTSPVVCMHCEDPACARVCPADAIKQDENGIVHSSLKPRCIGCSNCVLACPFGVPHYVVQIDQMMKCDMCFDRTSVGKKPMCATVCPSQALYYGRAEDIEQHAARNGAHVRHRRGLAVEAEVERGRFRACAARLRANVSARDEGLIPLECLRCSRCGRKSDKTHCHQKTIRHSSLELVC